MAVTGTGRDVPEEMRDQVEATLRRVADRLRTMSVARLRTSVTAGPDVAPGQTVADRARYTGQMLADLAAGIEQRDAPVRLPSRRVPVSADIAAGDQVEVTGQDLLSAAAELSPSTSVWVGSQRVTLHEVLVEAERVLDALRRAL